MRTWSWRTKSIKLISSTRSSRGRSNSLVIGSSLPILMELIKLCLTILIGHHLDTPFPNYSSEIKKESILSDLRDALWSFKTINWRSVSELGSSPAIFLSMNSLITTCQSNWKTSVNKMITSFWMLLTEETKWTSPIKSQSQINSLQDSTWEGPNPQQSLEPIAEVDSKDRHLEAQEEYSCQI